MSEEVIKLKLLLIGLSMLLIFSTLCITSLAKIEEDDISISIPSCGHITSSEPGIHNLTIDGNYSEALFILFWENDSSNLEFVLNSPSNKQINSSVQLPIVFQKNELQMQYKIPKPESGNWIARIIPKEMSDYGENYCTLVIYPNVAYNEPADLNKPITSTTTTIS